MTKEELKAFLDRALPKPSRGFRTAFRLKRGSGDYHCTVTAADLNRMRGNDATSILQNR